MRPTHRCPERGSTLIVVILVIAFMLAVGVAILTVSGTGPKVSGSVRDQEEAFNTAEAGFEAARFVIESNFFDGLWTNLPDNCFRTPAGIDLPHDANYFQKKTDSDILALVPIPTASNGVIFKDQPFTKTRAGTDDLSRTYTVFLIDDEAGSPIADPSDALLVCIGVIRSGNRILSTSRLEILIGIQTGGTNP